VGGTGHAFAFRTNPPEYGNEKRGGGTRGEIERKNNKKSRTDMTKLNMELRESQKKGYQIGASYK